MHSLSAILTAVVSLAAEQPSGTGKPAEWKGTVGAGLIYVDGNAFGLSGSLAAAAERKSEDWIVSGRASATYGEARASGETDRKISAYAAGLLLRLDRRFTPRLSTYLLGTVETDHVKSVEWRPGGEAGVGYVWIDSKSGDQATLLRTDLGFRVSQEYRFQYYPTAMRLEQPDLFLAPRVGVAFRHQFSKDTVFTEDVEFLPNVNGPARYLANSISKLGAKVGASLQFGLALTVNYDSAPAAGKKQADTVLAVTLDYVF